MDDYTLLKSLVRKNGVARILQDLWCFCVEESERAESEAENSEDGEQAKKRVQKWEQASRAISELAMQIEEPVTLPRDESKVNTEELPF